MSNQSRHHGAGYILIDNSASDWGNKIEADIRCCGLCEKILPLHDTVDHLGRLTVGWRNEGAYCHRCDKPLCHECGSKPCPSECGGFEKKFADAIEEQYRIEQNAKILGI
jgi:hypothetical protein